jgi:hypothetical protein
VLASGFLLLWRELTSASTPPIADDEIAFEEMPFNRPAATAINADKSHKLLNFFAIV